MFKVVPYRSLDSSLQHRTDGRPQHAIQKTLSSFEDQYPRAPLQTGAGASLGAGVPRVLVKDEPGDFPVQPIQAKLQKHLNLLASKLLAPAIRSAPTGGDNGGEGLSLRGICKQRGACREESFWESFLHYSLIPALGSGPEPGAKAITVPPRLASGVYS
ncbi:hypothetical protein SKAU_G00084920 [Synaphobranchus kaupii]|uniref:Uncharacterized protein n=1 Tax=Synaphobranchus kaupii TaxID=118154 RepID=A0A9Q1J5K2_SYNKA|nr:hypothetical protein SKAU_G00084920 [Synaphobranchus kaupii]